jgi:hypothetical protein
MNPPTAVMRCAGIKDWSKLDAELVKLVNAWPEDFSANIRGLFYRWARVIRKSVAGISKAPPCETAWADVLKNQIPLFPSVVSREDVRAFSNEGGDWRVLQLVADLDEAARLRLAGVFWRWGQVAAAIKSERWRKEWERQEAEQKQSPAAVMPRPVTSADMGVATVKLGREHAATIDAFRRKFKWGKDWSDAEIAGFFCRYAFLIPSQVVAAVERFIKYRDSEGLAENDALRAMIIATQRSAEQESQA